LVSHNKERTQTEGVLEQGAEGVFGPEREEVAGDLRRLHNEELHNIHFTEYY
jgi:hypothetical protein